MFMRVILLTAAVVIATGVGRADETLYRYEGNTVPYALSAGWLVFDPCELSCAESVEDDRFVLRFANGENGANYHLWIAFSADPPPPTLWVEWRFRSNHPIGRNFYSCDGDFAIRYRNTSDTVNMYGDAAISMNRGNGIFGLGIDELHTFRYESLDGRGYRISVDGTVFVDVGFDTGPLGAHYLQLRGQGGCDGFPNTVNEWDFVRYGTIDYGEQIISADPPAGKLNNIVYPKFDRFTVSFDSPNYVYIDEITVEVSAGIAPVVTQTRRQDNGPPETVEIVLDRPIPLGVTTFTFNDGTAVNVIEYSLFAGTPSDLDNDGVDDLLDNCPNHANSNQEDCDDDGTGDVCTIAECATGNTICADCDSNNLPDGCQPDNDGDGVIDACDPCPNEAGNDGDSDGDTIPDCADQCPGKDDLADKDGNNIPDCLEDIIIPTLSPWGLMILAAALFISARKYFRRRGPNTST